MGIRTLNTQDVHRDTITSRVQKSLVHPVHRTHGLQTVNDVREIRHDSDINMTGTLAGDSTWGIINKKRYGVGTERRIAVGESMCSSSALVQQLVG
jgi:hypothetical protein